MLFIRLCLVVVFASGFLALPAAAFDQFHTNLTAILRAHTRDGAVDYAALKREPAPLDAYIADAAAIPRTEFNEWKESEQIAYLANLYNACTLRLVRDHYPIASIKNVGGWFDDPWEIKVVRLWNRPASLDELEHHFLRPVYHEPRIHFALVCAARGCPPLRDEAYVGARLGEQLDDQGRRFLGQADKNRYDDATKTLHLSPIFRWYGTDFGADHAAIATFVRKYLPAIPPGLDRIRFTKYDWSLNDSPRPAAP